MTMDISETTAPRSDQQNYDDYVTGPKTVTVDRVTKGTAEQPVEIHLVEFPGRPFKPSKTVRRILVAAWGADAANYTGRRMTLYGDPTVKFGSAVVGGIRVSHLSHIEKPLTLQLTTTRAKRSPFKVEPLIEAAVPTEAELTAQIAATTDQGALRDMWNLYPNLRPVIEARVAELKGAQEQAGGDRA